MALKKRRKNGL